MELKSTQTLVAFDFTVLEDTVHLSSLVYRLSLRDSKECCVTSLRVLAFQKQTATILNCKGTDLIREKCSFRGYMRCHLGRLELLYYVYFGSEYKLLTMSRVTLFSNIKS